jgi:LPXTG-motif cell wall-anchored protein
VDADRRKLSRVSNQLHYPVSCVMSIDGNQVPARVINYHYKGACLEVASSLSINIENQKGTNYELDFYLGQKCIKRRIPLKIAWSTIQENRMIGIEFTEPVRDLVDRASRYACHEKLRPTVVVPDPLDINRQIYMSAEDLSKSGMLLSTSLTNKHILPGMILKRAKLEIPGQSAIEIDLEVANTRDAKSSTEFHVGVSVRSRGADFAKAVAGYVSVLNRGVNGEEQNAESLWKNMREELPVKYLKQSLSYSTVQDQATYEKLLRQRFAAYKSHGKVTSDDWRSMGQGLNTEGMLIVAQLGNKIVASMELRFGDQHSFRFEKYLTSAFREKLDLKNCVEINKLSVLPELQGTDVVLGLMQKAHSHVLSRGARDALIAATDKLAHMYKKIGFAPTGIRFPHPTLKDSQLQLLRLPKSAYLNGQLLNPGTWTYVYDATHAQLCELGITRDSVQTVLSRRLGKATLTVNHLRKKLWTSQKTKVDKTKSAKEAELGESTNERFIDSRWTQRHMIAGVIKPYILEADDSIGHLEIDKILETIGVPRSYLDGKSNWLSVDFLNEFLELFSKKGSIDALSTRAGFRSMQPEVAGINYYVLKHLATPKLALRQISAVTSKFNTTRTYTVERITDVSARIRIGVIDQQWLPRHSCSCLNWQENIATVIQILTGQRGVVKKVSCCYLGDDACTYDIQWSNFGFRKRIALNATAPAMIGALGWFVPAYLIPETGAIANGLSALLGASLSAVGLLYFRLRKLRKDDRELNDEFKMFEQETNDRYQDLQQAKTLLDQRYQEAKLLEEASAATMRQSDTTEIIRSALNNVCEKFGFDRAFVMLVDNDRKFLRTAAASTSKSGSFSGGEGRLLQFKVSVEQKRDNPVVLSSVFHSGQPVLINDVQAHKFQLTEESQKLIDELKTNGFMMVPIPGSKSTWGVLIADKTSAAEPIGKSDLVLLQRVCQQLGLALDKQAQLEHEKNLRRIFEKFVPAQIVADLSSGAEPSLGGNLREIACMFLDIRGFTSLSSTLPPQVCLNLVNRVFSSIQPIVHHNRGLIDKFLGDGALMVWGAFDRNDSAEVLCKRAVRSADEILVAIEKLNDELEQDALPKIQVGIGIHFGPAICGNVGSDARMEFTAIGSTVNVASRIESLCKKFDAEVVVSDLVFTSAHHNSTEVDASEWICSTNEQIRGISELMKVHYKLRNDVSNSVIPILKNAG